MKYVLLGELGPEWIARHEERVDRVMQKFAELGITLEAVYYTQGSLDFIDVLEAPDAESVLAFSMWYSHEGMGRVETLPAFDGEAMIRASDRI